MSNEQTAHYLSKKQSAKMMGVSESTVERLIRAGHLPTCPITIQGRSKPMIKIDPADIHSYMQSIKKRAGDGTEEA